MTRSRRDFFAALALASFVVVVAACPAPPSVGEGEGAAAEGEGGEGEGGAGEGEGAEGEGEGEGAAGEGEGTSVDQDPGDIVVFPADNPWNIDISDPVQFPVDPLSDTYLASIGLDTGLHADFDNDPADGIPFVIVDHNQALAQVDFDTPDESDPGPYPIPDDAPVEAGSDHHVLVVDRDSHTLYEVDEATEVSSGHWTGFSGAVFDLDSNALRPDFFTSADAAGLPIFPGLVRADEVFEAGVIDHALRFTVSSTQRAFIHPATHFASSDTNSSLPPMGLRVRLKPDFDITGFPVECQVILQALKTYGMIIADNGSDWFISGTSDPRFDPDLLHELNQVVGSNFEVVTTGPLITD